jgi:hypothetical protein
MVRLQPSQDRRVSGSCRILLTVVISISLGNLTVQRYIVASSVDDRADSSYPFSAHTALQPSSSFTCATFRSVVSKRVSFVAVLLGFAF